MNPYQEIARLLSRPLGFNPLFVVLLLLAGTLLALEWERTRAKRRIEN